MNIFIGYKTSCFSSKDIFLVHYANFKSEFDKNW